MRGSDTARAQPLHDLLPVLVTGHHESVQLPTRAGTCAVRRTAAAVTTAAVAQQLEKSFIRSMSSFRGICTGAGAGEGAIKI